MIDVDRNMQNTNLGSFADDKFKFQILNSGLEHTIMQHLKENIEGNDSVRDLKIIFEVNGKFDKHITSIVAKGNCMVG